MIKNYKIISILIFITQLTFLFSDEFEFENNQINNTNCEVKQPINLDPIYNFGNSIDTICSKRMYNFASFVYYQAIEQNLELGIFRALNRNNKSPSINIEFNFEPGFILGMGYHLDNDKIDMLFKYTFLHFTKQTTSSAPSGMQRIITPWFDENTLFTLRIESTWKFKYDFFDIEFKRESFSSKKLIIAPIIALSGGFIRQKYDLIATLSNKVNSSNRNRSYLIGPKVGINSSWIFNNGFDVTLNSSIAFLYQNFSTQRQAQRLDITSLSSNVKENSEQITPNAYLSLALRYGKYLDEKRKYVSFLASYDFNYLFNQNSFANLQSISAQNPNSEVSRNRADSNLGDLFLHGLNLTFYLSY
ncbi:MAG: hypothetical protein K1060chlam5_00783 [Candidatus Anoxychlamydiales bacterium]|nr:hypothetical protein [Candidatus Anoxychlamydiales bacterium]